MNKQYCPERQLPDYAFIPGLNPHPFKEGGHWFGQEEPIAKQIDESDPLANKDFCYALDLINHDYFWEAHVYLEALWNAHKRTGPIAEFLKAIIICCAGEVKRIKGQIPASDAHHKRVYELINILLKEHKKILGLNLDEILKSWKIHNYKINY